MRLRARQGKQTSTYMVGFGVLWRQFTATPMQLEPYEIHDLLLICGLDDAGWKQWSDLRQFQGFFERLRDFHRDRAARSYVMDMTRIAVARGAAELNKDQLPPNWTVFSWKSFVDTVASRGPGVTLKLQQMTGAQAEAMTPYLARQTPLSVHMFRYTRATLRAYQERGLVHGLATRRPEDVPVSFRSEVETQLYDRIDELCSKFYRLADLPPEERSGVGFLMAVFRKRLASSFYSFRRSLERRRDLIAAIQTDLSRLDEELERERQLLDEEDDEEEDEADLRSLVDRERRRLVRLYEDPDRREQLENERKYLHEYIGRLAQVVPQLTPKIKMMPVTQREREAKGDGAMTRRMPVRLPRRAQWERFQAVNHDGGVTPFRPEAVRACVPQV